MLLPPGKLLRSSSLCVCLYVRLSIRISQNHMSFSQACQKILRHHHINRHSKSVRSCHPLNIENAGKLSGSRGTATDSAGKLTAHPTLQAGAQGATIRLAVTQSPPLVLPVSSFCPLYLVFYPTLTIPTHYTGVVAYAHGRFATVLQPTAGLLKYQSILQHCTCNLHFCTLETGL